MSSPEAASGSSSDSSSEDEFDLGAQSAAEQPEAAAQEGEKEEQEEEEEATTADGGEAPKAKEGHSKLFSDDSEDEEQEQEKAPPPEDKSGGGNKEKEMEDLFGSDYDSEEEEFKASGVKESPVRDGDARHASGEAGDRAEHGGSGAGGHDDGALGFGAASELWLPKTPRAAASATPFVTKMPNILRLVPTQYTAAAIAQEMENPSDETLYRNYVRWRYKRNDADGRVLVDPETGRPRRESNAKLVQWEDGTLTMFVGKEALHLTRQKLANSFLFVNETSSDRPDLIDPEDEEEEVPGQEPVLECHSRLDEKLTIRPMTTSSKSHRSLTMSMRAKHNKGVQKVKQYISELDGDREQEQRVKIEDEKLRLLHRKKARQSFEYDRERAHAASSRMDASFLENDYDDDEHVGAIKQQFGSKGGKHAAAGRKQARRAASQVGMGFDDYSRQRRSRERERSDSEDEDAFAGRGRAPDAADEDEEDEDEEEMVIRTHKKRRTVEEDSD